LIIFLAEFPIPYPRAPPATGAVPNETGASGAARSPPTAPPIIGRESTADLPTFSINPRSSGLSSIDSNGAVGSNLGAMLGGNNNFIAGATGSHTHTYSGTTSGASTNHTHTFTTANNTGGGLAHNNLQPYIVLNYMIKV
jgi:hypothetical protein